MLTRLVSLVVRWPRRVLVGVALLFVVGVVVGGPVAGLMTSDVSDPHAADVVATDRMAAASGVDVTPDAVLLVRPGSSVRSGVGAADVAAVAAQLKGIPGVASVERAVPSAPAAAGSGLVSRDGRAALVIAHYRASIDPDPVSTRIIAAFAHRPTVLVGGDQVATLEITNDVTDDLALAELLVFPILMIAGLWIFRGLIATLVPLGLGAIAIVAALLGLRVVNSFDELSSYVLNLVIGLGLGLSIDYSLFIISRYREEAETAGYTNAALVRAVARSGRTVAFSALTVMAAMVALLVFPQRFLYSMGVGGVLVTFLAALGSVTALPAILALLGERINSWSTPRWRRNGSRLARDPTTSLWYRVAHVAMRRPVLTILASLVVVGIALWPARTVQFSNEDASSLPVSAAAHRVSDITAADFPGGATSELQMVLSAPPDARAAATALGERAARLSGVASTAAPVYLGRDTWEIAVTTRSGPYSGSSRQVVKAIHALRTASPVLLAGDAAAFVDLEQSMLAHLPLALGIVILVVLMVIFALTGSVVLAVKTLVFNALNVAAVLGILVWVFERGHLEGILRFHSTGTIDLTQPILVLVIAFGLSTDYGVFLLSRIKEAHDELGDGAEPIALGLARTGRIISSAAVLLCVAIGAFSTSSILFIKQIGVGVAFAVILDATLVRAFLVPAAMRLFGQANWWAPRPLRALSLWLHLDGAPDLGDNRLEPVTVAPRLETAVAVRERQPYADIPTEAPMAEPEPVAVGESVDDREHPVAGVPAAGVPGAGLSGDDLDAEVARLRLRNDDLSAELVGLREDSPRRPVTEADIVAAVGQQLAEAISSAHAAATALTTDAAALAARLIAEATAEAEAAASEIRAHAAATDAAADARLAAIEAAATGQIADAKAEADASLRRARLDAEEVVAAARRAAGVEADRIVGRARAEAESVRQQAAEERLLVVGDAERTRDRILDDLARRRRAATVQIEQLRAGRERLIDTYGVVRRTLDEVHDNLERADSEARAAAQEAGGGPSRSGNGGRPTVDIAREEAARRRNRGTELPADAR